MTFEQVVLLLTLLGGAIYVTFQITWTVCNHDKKDQKSGSKFSYWKISGLTSEEANQYNKQESFTFIMPDNAVTLEAMTQDDSIKDDGPDVLGTELYLPS